VSFYDAPFFVSAVGLTLKIVLICYVCFGQVCCL